MRLMHQTSNDNYGKDKLTSRLTTMSAYREYAAPQDTNLIWGDERFSTLKPVRRLNGAVVGFPDGYQSDQGTATRDGHTGVTPTQPPSQVSPVRGSNVRRAPMLRDLKGGPLWHSYDAATGVETQSPSNGVHRHERMDKLVNGSPNNHCIQKQMLPSMRSPENNDNNNSNNSSSSSSNFSKVQAVMKEAQEEDDRRWLAREAMKTRAVSLDMGYQARVWTPGNTPPGSGAGTPTKEKVTIMEVKQQSPRSLPLKQQQQQPSQRPTNLKLVSPTNGYIPHHHHHCNGDVLAYTPPSTPTSPNSDHQKHTTNIRPKVLETIAESSRTKTLNRTLKRSAKSDSHVLPFRRSNSTPDILEDLSYDSDNDNDDYGFLSYYRDKLSSSYPSASPRSATNSSRSSSTAMQKAKSPSQTHRILPKKWRKSKLLGGSSRSGACLWKKEAPCTWSSASGRKVILGPIPLGSLTEVEKLALQKIALAKLHSMDLGCSVNIPKEWNSKRSKKSAFSLKRRTVSSSILDNFKDKGKDKDGKEKTGGWVFGIPLGKVIANDIELRRRKPSLLRERRESLDLPQVHRPATRKSSSSSVSQRDPERPPRRAARPFTIAICDCHSIDLIHSTGLHLTQSDGGAISSDSLSESDCKGASSNLLDALSLLPSSKLEDANKDHHDDSASSYFTSSQTPQVPYIVNCCVKHLETYGLRVLGIFRIGSSKKRIKQLREDFDTGKDVKLNEEHNPHDVGAVFKEFFRDLSDPLLTRDLYSAFVATRKLGSQEKRMHALHLLVSLLPATHIDTLWTLLTFLQTVVEHSMDEVDEQGQELPGNKMNSHNLATLFGPNILHKSKGGEFQVETLERADDRQDVIHVVEDMIDNLQRVFEVSALLHDELMSVLMETNPEAADKLLNMKSNVLTIEIDPETSSSMYESDSSSIPHSPSYGSEMDTGQPRNLQEALALQQQQQQKLAPPLKHKVKSLEPAGSIRKTASANRLTAPDPGWYKPERSKSPASPRISPSPKAMRAGPNLHIRITAESPERTMCVDTPQGSVSPRTRSRSGHGHGQSSHMLTVPSASSKSRHRDSNSSLSSGYMGGSSRSGTNSPSPPSHSSKWYLETPPESPSQGTVNPKGRDTRECSPSPFQRTSSTHRPLGINVHSQSSGQLSSSDKSSADSQEWQKERWRHWEKLAKEHSDDFHEQETLV